MMDSSRIFKQNNQMVYREEEDGAFLFNPETGDLRYMNRSGREAYSMLNGEKDFNRVVQNMMDLYPDADPSQLQNDVETFFGDLEKNHFILPSKSR